MSRYHRALVGADKAQRLAYRAVYIPKTYRLQPGPSGGAVYVGEGTTTKGLPAFYAMAFRGTAGRPAFHVIYRTDAQRQAAIAAFWAGIASSQQFKQTQNAQRNAWVNPAKVGDLLYTSWGYDQTNVEFYAVTRVSGKRVWIREIAQDSESTGVMQAKCWPAMPIRFCGDETMHLARSAGDHGYAVKINQSATAWLDKGQTHYSSSYA